VKQYSNKAIVMLMGWRSEVRRRREKEGAKVKSLTNFPDYTPLRDIPPSPRIFDAWKPTVDSHKGLHWNEQQDREMVQINESLEN